jgi:predicted type IV restriction endonuclease
LRSTGSALLVAEHNLEYGLNPGLLSWEIEVLLNGVLMSAPREIRELVERFERQLDAYRSPQYNETQLRREFLDPFFKALGWDIDNEQGYAEAYKDVIHEDAIKVGEGTKAPDYCFRIGGTRKFFLEAKKPAVDIKHDVSPAFQLRRYAWTSSVNPI